MKRQISGAIFALAAVLVLGACVSTLPAKQVSNRELSEFLSGYVRVVSNDQELFCSRVHFRLDACYTRAQMHERLLASLRPDGVSTAGPPQIQPSASIYTSFNASGH